MADCDRILGFTIPERNVRGRLVRLCGVVDDILTTHDYAEPLARLLGEALALTAMLGDLLRADGGDLTLQARGEGGPVSMLVSDYRDYGLRGYAALAEDGAGIDADAHSLRALLGEGYLALTVEQTAGNERYQGIVELADTTLAEAAGNYFRDSEQQSSLLRLHAGRGVDGRWVAGGLLLQRLPRSEMAGERLSVDGDDAGWEHAATLAATVTDQELLDEALPFADLLWRLFHGDEVHVLTPTPLSRNCRCSLDHIRAVLAQFPPAERAEMREADGRIHVACEFCARDFAIDL